MLLDKLKMEFIGTFVLVYFAGLNLVGLKSGYTSLLAVGVSNFVVYGLLLWMGKAVSGSQYNPVITICLLISRHVKLRDGLTFIFCQTVAAIFAISMLKMSLAAEDLNVIKQDTILGFPLMTANPIQGILLETIGGFFIVLAYYTLLLEPKAPKYVYGAGISAVFLVTSMALYQKTGCSLNPARSLAYALIGNRYRRLYVYIIGPIFGGIIGSFLGNLLLSEKADSLKLRMKNERKKQNNTAPKKRHNEQL